MWGGGCGDSVSQHTSSGSGLSEGGRCNGARKRHAPCKESDCGANPQGGEGKPVMKKIGGEKEKK